jgi:hypothetical protein
MLLQAVVEPASAGDNDVALDKKADGRSHGDGDDLGDVPGEIRRHLRVDDDRVNQSAEQPAAYPDVD